MRDHFHDVTSKVRHPVVAPSAHRFPVPLVRRVIVAHPYPPRSLMHVSRLLFATYVTASLLAPSIVVAQAPAPAVQPAILKSQVFIWEQLKVKTTAVGQLRDIVNLPSATFEKFESHITTLNVGQASHAPHRHAREEFIIIKDGTVEVHINGRTQLAGPGSLRASAQRRPRASAGVGNRPSRHPQPPHAGV